MLPVADVQATVSAFDEMAPNRSNPAGAIDGTRAIVAHVYEGEHAGG
jgi:hypothetical protein